MSFGKRRIRLLLTIIMISLLMPAIRIEAAGLHPRAGTRLASGLTKKDTAEESSSQASEGSSEESTENPAEDPTEEADKEPDKKPVIHAGWNCINGKYYYYNSKKVLVKNSIVGSKSSGYRYVDKTGVRVDNANIQQAVKFVMTYTKPGWSRKKKIKTCYKKIIKKYKFKNMGDISKLKAADLPGRASYFFRKKKGDCLAHAASFASIARVLGYDSRIMKGRLYRKMGRTTYVSDHGYAEIKKGKKWYIYDLTMSRRAPKRKFVNVTSKKYHKKFKVKKKKYFNLVVSNGIIQWN